MVDLDDLDQSDSQNQELEFWSSHLSISLFPQEDNALVHRAQPYLMVELTISNGVGMPIQVLFADWSVH